MSIPQLTTDIICRNTTDKSWQRGQDYYKKDSVRQIYQRGNLITAEVIGNNIRSYIVNIDCQQNELKSAHCSCPYDWSGYCKHIVAVLLTCLHRPDHIQTRSSLEEILDRLNEVQTQNLIQKLVADQPRLIGDIERFADRHSRSVCLCRQRSCLQNDGRS